MPQSFTQRSATIFWESFIKVSGWASSFIVLVIIIFLFREGASLFWSTPLEKGLVIAVHPSNPVKSIREQDLHRVLAGEITDWKELGGTTAPIFSLNTNNIESTFKKLKLVKKRPEEIVGQQYERFHAVLDSLMQHQPGALFIFQRKYIPPQAKQVELSTISLSDFIFGANWEPTESPSPLFGVLPLLLGTLLVTFGAIFFALILGPPVAIYLAELATPKQRNIIKPLVELLAGIPSVVFGFIGLVILVPNIQAAFGLSSGSTALAGALLLAIIALPTIISVAEDAIRSTPMALKEASLGLGATHWQTIYYVVLPYCRSSFIAALILGVGRIVGETMAVLMVTGNNPQIVGFNFLASVRTMSAAIAAEMGEAPQGGLHYKALFAVGCLLFIFTFIINFIGEILKRRSKHVPHG
jgi:phosphate transport system permease protein